MELDYSDNNKNKCVKYDCQKKRCKCGLMFELVPAALGDDSPNSEVAPVNGAFCNKIVKYEANGAVYIFGADGIPVKIRDGQ